MEGDRTLYGIDGPRRRPRPAEASQDEVLVRTEPVWPTSTRGQARPLSVRERWLVEVTARAAEVAEAVEEDAPADQEADAPVVIVTDAPAEGRPEVLDRWLEDLRADVAAATARIPEAIQDLRSTFEREIEALRSLNREEAKRLRSTSGEEQVRTRVATTGELERIRHADADKLDEIRAAHGEELVRIRIASGEEIARIRVSIEAGVERLCRVIDGELDRMWSTNDLEIERIRSTGTDRLVEVHDLLIEELARVRAAAPLEPVTAEPPITERRWRRRRPA